MSSGIKTIKERYFKQKKITMADGYNIFKECVLEEYENRLLSINEKKEDIWVVGAFPLCKTAPHSINKKRSQQCKQAWMRSAAHALYSYKSTA
jgi:hypothetical protein